MTSVDADADVDADPLRCGDCGARSRSGRARGRHAEARACADPRCDGVVFSCATAWGQHRLATHDARVKFQCVRCGLLFRGRGVKTHGKVSVCVCCVRVCVVCVRVCVCANYSAALLAMRR